MARIVALLMFLAMSIISFTPASATPTYHSSGVGTLIITPRQHAHPRQHHAKRTFHRAHQTYRRHHVGPLPSHEDAHSSNVVANLDAKVHELEADCGAHVISGFRPGARVAGSGRVSQHAYNHARDLKGDYACMYRHLSGWVGGYSTDPGRVGHIHVSLGGPEDGRRFAHGGHGSGHRHYARLHGAYAQHAVFYTKHWRHRWRSRWS